MNLVEIAEKRHQGGYSCSQSVFSSLAGRWNISPEVSLRISAGLSGGIAQSAGTCGCVTGAVLAIGLAQSDVSPEENRAGKEKTCEACRSFMRAFEERNGSTVCRELIGCDISMPEGLARARREGLFHSRCSKFVRDAVELVESMTLAVPDRR